MTTKNKQKLTDDILLEISQKLDKVIILLSSQGKSSDIQIRILRDFGLEWDEIGKYTGLKPDAARKRYTRHK